MNSVLSWKPVIDSEEGEEEEKEGYLDYEEESVGGDEGDSDEESSGYELPAELQCYDCLGEVCPSSYRCTECFALCYACPDTGLCTHSGVWAWLKCSSSRPGFKAPRGAAKEGAFELAFVAYRIRGGILNEEPAEGGWICCVDNDYYYR